MNKVIKQHEISVRGLFYSDLYADRIEKEDIKLFNYIKYLLRTNKAIQITVKAEGINKFIFFPAVDGMRCADFCGNKPESHTTDIDKAIDNIVMLNHFTELYIKF